MGGVMAFPQGINFRSTAGFVTDGTNEDWEFNPNGGHLSTNYPHTTAQGNNVGWEGSQGGFLVRDRNSGVDSRLAGFNGVNNSVDGTRDYRLDLSGSGDWVIRGAFGDHDYARGPMTIEVFDTSSSLGTLVSNQSTAAGTNWFDATGVERTTVADWVNNNAPVTKTFTTTICRIRCGIVSGSDYSAIAHINLTAVAAAGAGRYLGRGMRYIATRNR